MRTRYLAGLMAVGLSVLAQAEPLVGPSVGNADVLATEGAQLYNKRKYAQAAEGLLRATRANPAQLSSYLLLARSYLGAKQVRQACLAYKAYLKAAPDSTDRLKAAGEQQLCEKQLRRATKQPPDLSQQFTEEKAAFFKALEQGLLLGAGSAGETLRTLVKQGYLGVDLGDMATKLSQAAVVQAEALFKKSTSKEGLSAQALQQAPALYQLAQDTGSPAPTAPGRAAFMDGLGLLKTSDYPRAEERFADASKREPQMADYKYYRAIALYRQGKSQGAVQVMETELPDDPRTGILRAAIALDGSAELGATELERVLFSRRFDSR